METKQNLIIATDGSQASKIAFYQAVEFYEYKNVFNQIIIAHVADLSKTYLPFEFKSETIQEDYKIELVTRYPQDNYKLIFDIKDPDEENIRNQILLIAKKNNSGFLIVGFHGRKGVKRDVSILGQTVRNSVYNSSIPLLVVKQLYKRDETNGFKFVVCVDGSKKSYKALNATIQLTFDERDSLLIVFAPTPDNEAFNSKIKQKITEHMSQFKRNWNYKLLAVSYDYRKTLIDLINNSNDLDFIAFGTNGYRAQLERKIFFGNTADQLLKHAKANVLIVP